MIFHSNTKPEEFLDWLRYSAIAGGMPTQFIDCIDQLEYLTGLEEEIAKAGEKINTAQGDAEDLYVTLHDLVAAIDADTPDKYPRVWAQKLAATRSTLERQEEYK